MLLKESIKKYGIFLMIFCIGFSLRIYALSIQPPLHVDEPCTFALATSSNKLDKGIPFKKEWNRYNFLYGKDYNSQDIQKAFFVGEKSLSAVINDLSALRKNNIDRQHPTLYYSIMRLWNLPLGSFDPKDYINHARSFNFILYIFSFLFMYKLLKAIKDDKRFIALGLFFAFISSGGIMLDTMAREYSLMTLFLIILTYLTFIIAKKIINGEKLGSQELICYPISASLFLLSGYYAVAYTLIMFGILFVLSLGQWKWRTFGILVTLTAITILYTILFYPDYFDFSFHNEHYATVKSNALNAVHFRNILHKLPTLGEHLKKYVFNELVLYTIILIIVLSFTFPNFGIHQNEYLNKKERWSIVVILFCAFIWAFAVNHTVVYLYYARYILPATAIYCLLISWLVYRFNKIATGFVTCLALLYSIYQIHEGAIFDKDRIQYTNSMGHKVSTYTQVPKNWPIIIVKPVNYPIEHVMYATVSPKNNVVVRFENKIPSSNYRYNQYTLIAPSGYVKGIRPFLNIRGNMKIYLINNKERTD